MLLKKNHVVAIDIDDVKIKLIYLKQYRGEYELIETISLETPPNTVINGIILEPQILGERIGELVRDYKLTGKKTITAVSGSQIYIKNLLMPKMKQTELRQAAQFEATKFLPIPVPEMVIDTFPLKNKVTENGLKTELFFVAIRRQQIENIEKCLKIANLNLKIIDLKPLAINRIIANPKNYSVKALLNIEASRSDFSILNGENLLFYHPFGLGYLDLDKDVEENHDNYKQEIINELVRAIEYYNNEYQMYPETIIITGYNQIDNVSKLQQLIKDNIFDNVQIGEVNFNLVNLRKISEFPSPQFQAEYMLTLGLAIRGGL